MRTKTLAWLAGLLLAGSSCTRDEARPEDEASPQRVAVYVVGRESVERIYEASGALRSFQTAVVTSKIPGYVREVRVRAGEQVSSGQILVALERGELEARLRAAQAALAQAESAEREAVSGLEAAGARAEVAESTFHRFEKLEAERAVTAQEMDEVRSRYLGARADRSMAEARLATARSGLERARAEVAGAEAVLGYTEIRAPFAGRVTERRVDAGNLAAPGAPLLVVEQEGPLHAEVTVDESQAGRIHLGDEARVLAGGEAYAGRVREVFASVDPESRSFVVKVDLPADAKVEGLLPGMFARVQFDVGREERLLVPRSAILRRGQLELVYVVEDGRARLRLVTLGRQREESFEALSGLNEGDRVVEQAGAIAREGQRVEQAS